MPSDYQKSTPASAPPPPCACRPRLPAAATRLNRHRCLPVMVHNLSGLLAARSKAKGPAAAKAAVRMRHNSASASRQATMPIL